MGGSSIPVNSSPDGAMVCLQPRADSLRLAFWELTVYKIENLQLRGIRLTLDRALLQTARGGEGSRFLFRESFRDDVDKQLTSFIPFSLEAKPHISDDSCKENVWLRQMGM